MKTVGDLGEFGTLETIAKHCPSAQPGKFEDANLMEVNGEWFINNTDSLPHHLPMPSPFHTAEKDKFYWAGWISVITTMNDLAVSGNQHPMGFSTRLVLHPSLNLNDLDRFIEGISDACKECDIEYTGGDTTLKDFQDKKKKIRLIECTTNAVGYIGARENYISRNTSKLGDLIALTTKSGVGWAKLIELTNAGFNPFDEEYMQFCKQHKKEMIPVEISPTIPQQAFAQCAREQLITSATDLSDGMMLIYLTSFFQYSLGMNLKFESDAVSRIAKEVCANRQIHPINALISQGLDAPNMHMLTFNPKHEVRVRNHFLKDSRDLYVIGQIIDQPRMECSYEGEKLMVQEIISDGALDPEKAENSLIWYKKDGKKRRL
jgi:thiamine monophosphate kinase